MSNSLPLREEQKLLVTYRVEPGCLGPEGDSLVSAFCDFAHKEIQTLNSNYANWIIVPRNDKNLPEMQYEAVGKVMSHSQAEKYLAIFDKSLDEFEGDLSNKVVTLIDKFMNR